MIKNSDGEVSELICTYDPDTRSGTGTSDKKVKGTIHWVSARHSLDAKIRLYDRLFKIPNPSNIEDIENSINPNSLETVSAKLESSLDSGDAPDVFQLERNGYFCIDKKEKDKKYNRIVTLRDSWAKIEKQALNL